MSGSFGPRPERSPEQIASDKEQLIRWLEEGLTTQQMADRLGVSKNVIIGRIARADLSKPRDKPPQPPPPRFTFPPPRHCQWPKGNPIDADFHFCAAPVHANYPYCLNHCQRAYIAFNPDHRRVERETVLPVMPKTRTHDGAAPRPMPRKLAAE